MKLNIKNLEKTMSKVGNLKEHNDSCEFGKIKKKVNKIDIFDIVPFLEWMIKEIENKQYKNNCW